jgi:hypothetical protein
VDAVGPERVDLRMSAPSRVKRASVVRGRLDRLGDEPGRTPKSLNGRTFGERLHGGCAQGHRRRPPVRRLAVVSAPRLC